MTKQRRVQLLFTISIILNLLFIAFVIGKRIYYYRSGLPENRKDIVPQTKGFITYKINIADFHRQMLNTFEAMPHDTTDIVFVGTSLTANFPFELLKNINIKNRGIGGNTITDISNRISEVTKGKPKAVFLEAGTNDLKPDSSIDTAFNHWQKVVESIRKRSPHTRLFIESTLPFGKDNNKMIESYNAMLYSYCLRHNIDYINLYPYYLDKNKQMRTDLTTDGTHLQISGYLIWKSQLDKYLKQL